MKSKITIRLYLQYPKIRKKISPVLMSVSWNGERVFKSTGVSVFPDEWDKKKEDVKNSADNAQAINLYLTLIRKEISEYHFNNLRTGTIISKNDMRTKMDSIIQNAKYTGGNSKGFFDYYEEYLNIREKNNKYKPKTHENHRMIFGIVKQYAEFSGEEITFDSIDENFKDRFLNYLYNERKNTNNTAKTTITLLKAFLYYALKYDWTQNSQFTSFSVSAKDPGFVALDETEIRAIELLTDLSGEIEIARKLFLIQIYTGLRLSDLFGLKLTNIDFNRKEIRIYTIKTESYLIIPIHKKLSDILEYFPPNNFNLLSKTKYNQCIKRFCEAAGIDSMVEKTRYSGSKRINKELPKYKMISSHTARRTFITILLDKSVSPEDIMKITGHKDWSSFQKYIKNPQARAVSAVRAAWEKEIDNEL